MGRQAIEGRFDRLPFGGDPWAITATGEALALPQCAAIFTIGNGFIGVRGPGDAPGAPRVYLNGVYERVPIQYHEAAHGYARESDTRLAVADATQPLILVDGKPLPPPTRVTLDLARAVLVVEVALGEYVVVVETLATMAHPGVVASRVHVPAALIGRISVTPRVSAPPSTATETGDGPYDPRVAPALASNLWQADGLIDEQAVVGRVDRLRASGFAVAALAMVVPAAASGDAFMIDCFAAYAAEREQTPLTTARDALEAARSAGFHALADAQRAWFADHWQRSALAFPGEPQAEQAVRHALFQLVQAAGRDGTTSIAAKGQSGEGYEGHVFWDADLYVLPVFALTRPDIARAMLQWRIGGLEAACANARLLGQARGALYPWRTIGGSECSSFFPAGSAQYHINADIAFALDTYVQATGDRSILSEGGAEMLVETARIWLEIGFHDPARGGAFVINRVTGPDEYSAIVDNNLYTNMMAQRHLRLAAREGQLAGLIDAAEAEAMRAAADAMLLSYDESRGIYLQDEGFFGKEPWPFADTPDDQYPLLLHYHPLTIYRYQVAKQADAVLAVALMPEAFEPDMRRRMLDMYEAVTVHDSTLSASAFAIAAARAGEGARAVRYWQVAALTDLANLFGNTDHGLHMAALAGSWSAIAWGFAGLRIEGDSLCVDPVAVPGFDRYGFTVSFRGSRVRINVEGAATALALEDGDPVSVRIGDAAPVMLQPGRNVPFAA